MAPSPTQSDEGYGPPGDPRGGGINKVPLLDHRPKIYLVNTTRCCNTLDTSTRRTKLNLPAPPLARSISRSPASSRGRLRPTVRVDTTPQSHYNGGMNASVHDEWLTGVDEYESPDDVARRYAEKQAQVVPGVSSGALLEAMENPEVFQEVARADLYVQMALMRRQAQDPRFSPSQRLDYMKRLAEMGKVAQPERDMSGTSNLPVINIVLPGSGQNVQIGAASVPEKDVTTEAKRVA